MAQQSAVRIRPYESRDHQEVTALAPRLTEWVAPWRDPGAVLRAVRGWVRTSVEATAREGHALYVALAGDRVAGLVSVAEQAHFSGQVDAYVGELVVAPGYERRGIAMELMQAAEDWAARRGLAFITLETGAANHPARSLYAALGYQEEDVRLTKPVRRADGPATGATS